MSIDFNLEPLHNYIEHIIVPQWMILDDRKQELQAEGKTLELEVTKELDEILGLFHAKEYRKGLEAYIQWLFDRGYPVAYADIKMIVKYGEHFGIDSAKLEKLSTAYKGGKEYKYRRGV